MQGGIVLVERGGKLEGFLTRFPIEESEALIFSEVLLADRDAVELGLEEGFGLGERIDPGENYFERLASLQALIEFFLDGAGELDDFSIHRSLNGWGVDS